jgi:DNA mismatch repair ATPase MutS
MKNRLPNLLRLCQSHVSWRLLVVQRHSTTLVDDRIPPSALLRQVMAYQQSHPTQLLLVRVGDFYESYFDQADVLGTSLNITVINRAFRAFQHPVRFTGFPSKSLDKHLRVLVRECDKTVAIMEQFQDGVTKVFTRRVTRVVTAGTLMDDDSETKYVLAVAQEGEQAACAWVDVSTGDFSVKSCAADGLVDALAVVRPVHVIVPTKMDSVERNAVDLGYRVEEGHVTGTALFDAQFAPRDISFSPVERLAGSMLLHFLRASYLETLPLLQYPIKSDHLATMKIDKSTVRNMELCRSLREDSRVGSLIHAVDCTLTRPGARLLQQRLRTPIQVRLIGRSVALHGQARC